jgi:hypothetical protein
MALEILQTAASSGGRFVLERSFARDAVRRWTAMRVVFDASKRLQSRGVDGMLARSGRFDRPAMRTG